MKNLLIFSVIFFLTGFLNMRAQNTITILHMNDTHSTLSDLGPRNPDLSGTQGGIARAASVIGFEKTLDPDLLLLHAGDISIGDLFFNRFFQGPELTWMSMIGFDAMALGNHEFDLTPEVLLGSLQNVFPNPANAFPLLGANVNASAIPELDAYISDYTTKDIGTVKVGIFGLLTPATNLLSQPLRVIIEEDVEEIMNIAGTNAFLLRSLENCDVVILLSHLGVEFDMAIATMVPGIDLVIGGHDHYKYEQPLPVTNPTGGTTWVAQAGSNYMYIGKMKINVDAAGNISLLDYAIIPLDENVPEEPTVKTMVDGLISDIETFYDTPFFTQPFGFANAFHKEEAANLAELGSHDTPVGNLVTDAFRNFTGTEIAIHAGGSTALPLWEGQFTMADIFRINGYGFNTINTLGFQLATFNITGEALWMGLEFGLSEIESNDEFFIQVSGLEYKYDATKPVGERVVSVLVNGQTINHSAVYSVTASELVLFLLDYLQIPYSNPNILTGVTEFEAVTAHVMSLNNFLHPKEIGRIINVGEHQPKNKIIGDGWFNSAEGSFIVDPTITGTLSFNMNLHNSKHPNSVQGVVKIKFPSANINLTGNNVECLLIEDNIITVRGEGKNTGKGKYGFLITAIDGGNTGDLIKITLWDKLDGDRVIYDNLIMNALGGGYITINNSQLVKDGNEGTLPGKFILYSNYPNPFNPSTTFEFQIPNSETVTLKVYDIIGNEVSTIVNEQLPSGTYKYQWDASGLASGVYFYKLQAGGFVETKKLILLR